MPPGDERLPDSVFDALVDAEIDGRASDEEIDRLFAEARRWRKALFDRLDEADDAVDRAKRIDGPERAQVVMDFESIGDDIDAALDRLDLREGRELPEPDDAAVEVETTSSRFCRRRGQPAAWSCGSVDRSDVISDERRPTRGAGQARSAGRGLGRP